MNKINKTQSGDVRDGEKQEDFASGYPCVEAKTHKKTRRRRQLEEKVMNI